MVKFGIVVLSLILVNTFVCQSKIDYDENDCMHFRAEAKKTTGKDQKRILDLISVFCADELLELTLTDIQESEQSEDEIELERANCVYLWQEANNFRNTNRAAYFNQYINQCASSGQQTEEDIELYRMSCAALWQEANNFKNPNRQTYYSLYMGQCSTRGKYW